MKMCSKCHTEFPLTSEYFRKDKNSKDGFYRWCKKCKNEADNKSYHKNIENNHRKRKEWRDANRDIKREQDKAYREKMKNRNPSDIAVPKAKTCTKCDKTKTYDKFFKDITAKDGLDGYCKKCAKMRNEKSYQKHKEKRKISGKEYRELNKGKLAITHKNYYQNHKKKIKKYKKLWQIRNKIRLSKQQKIYRASHKEQANKRNKNRKKNDINYKILCNLRTGLSQVLNVQRARKSDHTMMMVGCSVEELKIHLESQFSTSGMSFDNYGKGDDKWSIDHIRPCSSFDLTDPKQQLKCFHYSNLQPLWNIDNLKKNSLYNGKYIRRKYQKQ